MILRTATAVQRVSSAYERARTLLNTRNYVLRTATAVQRVSSAYERARTLLNTRNYVLRTATAVQRVSSAYERARTFVKRAKLLIRYVVRNPTVVSTKRLWGFFDIHFYGITILATLPPLFSLVTTICLSILSLSSAT